MRVLVRVDVHPIIGFGHLSRCLNLCQVMKLHGWNIAFIGHGLGEYLDPSDTYYPLEYSNSNEALITTDTSTWLGELPNELAQKNDWLQCRQILEAEYDLIIVDHYALDIIWELCWTNSKILVIDDLLHRFHYCHYFIDYSVLMADIGNRVPDFCKIMLGPSFALLDIHLCDLIRKDELELDGKIHLLINFGGYDADNYTEKVLLALERIFYTSKNNQLFQRINEITIVRKNKKPIETLLETLIILKSKPIHVYDGLSKSEFLKLLGHYKMSYPPINLCIGAAGVSTFERACLGIPSILICTAENQIRNAKGFATLGAGSYLEQWNDDQFELILGKYLCPESNLDVSLKCRKLVDGRGVFRVFYKLSRDFIYK